MADPLSFLPLRQETLARIRDRLDADVNAGRDPAQADFIDTEPGGIYWDLTQALALEIERLWDMASIDVPSTTFLEFAWGEYLDEHGEGFSVPRKDAVRATGSVTFTGDEGVIIAVGTQAETEQTDADTEPVAFEVVTGGTVSGGTVTLPVQAVEPGSMGNVAASAISVLASPVDGITAVENAESTSGGTEVETDEAYRDRLKIEAAATQGAGAVRDYERWALAYPGVGNVRIVPLWSGAGTVRVIITDADRNPVSQTVEDGLQQLLDPWTAQTTINQAGGYTLPVATINVVSTSGFASAGRIQIGSDLVTYTGVTGTSFTGCSGGTGTHANGTAVTQSGFGAGLAPIGAIVTVDTPAALTVNITATVTYVDGYSEDGTGGTIPLAADIEEALGDYINGLPPGGEDPPGAESPAGSGFVLLNKVEARFFQVPGVYNIASVQINGSAADLSVSPLQVPVLGTVTLN